MLDKKEVKTYIVKLYCNHCGHEMESDGTVLCSYLPQYPYVCPNCGSKITANEKYPKIEYEEIEENKDSEI